MAHGVPPSPHGLLQRLLARWPLLLAVAFTLYSALLLTYAASSWQRMRQDANAWLVADSARRAAALGDLVAELNGNAQAHADLHEIRAYLINRDLGMSPRYGLNAALAIIDVAFRQRAAELAARWQIVLPHIAFLAPDCTRLAGSRPGTKGTPLPAADDEMRGRIDVAGDAVVVAAPVRHKDKAEGTVVTAYPIEILFRNLLPAGASGGYRELLISSSGELIAGRDDDMRLEPAQLRVLAGLADHTVMETAVLLGESGAATPLRDSLLVKADVPGMPLVLVSFVPEKLAYGHLLPRTVLVGAGALLLVMLLGAFKLDRMRRRAEQLEAEVAAAERQRAIAEIRNVELAEEIRRRELAEQERRSAEARTMDRNEQLNAIFDLSPDGFVAFDAERRVKYANPAFLAMTGHLESELIGLGEQEFSALVARDCRPETPFPGIVALRRIKEAEAAGPPSDPRQSLPRLLIELGGAVKRVLELKLRLAGAATVSQILYARDITHEVEVDRMKSEFLSHAAHELRTPMASIYGFAELLMQNEFDAATRNDVLKTIYDQTGRLVDIINELLDLARIEARRGKDLQIASIALPPLIEKVAARLQFDAERWPLVIASVACLPPVRADAAKLEQALTNILGNAVKYSPAGGEIAVRCTTRQREGRMEVGIAISDHGIGMSSEQLAHVCERFWRADTSGNIPGTGLGMTIVKEIVEQLGGRMEIDSRPGEGTTVTLWLPTVTRSSEEE